MDKSEIEGYPPYDFMNYQNITNGIIEGFFASVMIITILTLPLALFVNGGNEIIIKIGGNEMFSSSELYTTNISCESDSMGLSITCGMKAMAEKYEMNESLEIGRIYIYNGTKGTVVHRLVGCIDSGCNLTIFKGDNNLYSEKVNRSRILYKVARFEYG